MDGFKKAEELLHHIYKIEGQVEKTERGKVKNECKGIA